ncbi:putative E3 ubiquitin-protein ligase SINA-like 6 [Orchesella cincta]|uniref:Putative E3 ubiquitin-protein ligase SINA-like 6 n=1 Tax=Orchesella cincta TaxID=48709 RepID=A0A1D2M8J9_ORCCI|nr:putative E3 ubiquitin-protein ligase SINA-like 6 [Orchesella cincta]
MEKFRTCPICLEVPEQEIFQCRNGHVICNLCITKVRGCSICPQCRVPFGTVRIRNRLFEEMLDSQVFDCKFQELGCAYVCKRGEITTHVNSCLYNPDTVSVCEQLGIKNCTFRLGCISRAEVISHFEEVHKCSFKLSPSLSLRFNGSSFMEILSHKRKAGATRVTNPSFICAITGKDTSEFSPLFLLCGKLKQSTECLSFYCLKIWEPTLGLPKQFNAVFSLFKNPSLISSSSSNSASEPSTSTWTSSLPNAEYNPFPICGLMRVGGIKDIRVLLKASTINIPISLLEDHRFGTNKDYFQAEITPISGASNVPGMLSGLGAIQLEFSSSSNSPTSSATERQLL